MKKLMFGAFAALCAGVLFAEDTVAWPYIYYACDLSEQAYSENPYSWVCVRCGQGATRTYTLGADLNESIIQWSCLTEWWRPDVGSTMIMDFSGGHTYYIKDYLELMAYVENSVNSTKSAMESAQAKLYVRNATIDGQGAHHMLIGQSSANQSFTNGLIEIENSSITNLTHFYVGRQMAHSQINFKNSIIHSASGTLALCDANRFGEEDLTITFENTKVEMGGQLHTDTGTGYSAPYHDIGRRYVFTGTDTVAHFGSNIMGAQAIPYCQILVDNGAQLRTDCGFYFGIGSTDAEGWTITVQNNASIKVGWGLYFGWDSGNHTLILKDGGAIKGALNIGRYTDNNTLIVSNGDLSACGSISVGGANLNKDNKTAFNGCPSGNKALIHGQQTKFNGNPFNDYIFMGKDGLLYLDDVTVSGRKTYYLNAKNPDPASEDDNWVNNTLYLDNGTTVAAADFLMGNFYASTNPANNQHLIVGADSTLDVSGQFMNAGADDTIVVSNGTIQVGSQWGFYVGYSTGETPFTVARNSLTFKGNHPRIQKRAGTQYGESYVMNDSTVRFELPEDGVYSAIPYEDDHVVFGGDVNLEFGNVDKVRKNITAAKDIALIRGALETGIDWEGKEQVAGLNIQQKTLNAANEKLAEAGYTGCYTYLALDEGCEHKGTVYLHVVPEGLSYDTAFKSIQAYNDAVTNEATASIYADKDAYLVLSNDNFLANTDYSLLKQSTKSTNPPRLHVFFYNCTFPEATDVKGGTMSPDNGDVFLETSLSSNRKMIALCVAKEVWIEGCTFNNYQGDSYVIDLNLYNKFENEGCGITIKGNKFLSGAGKRVPISVKNKENLPPAFVLIEGNEFAGCAHDISDTKDVTENSTYAGVICFGDQLKAGSTTANGANFPITIQNNTFADGVTQYVVMSGMYVSSGKQGLDIPVGTSYTWAYDSEKWVSTPAFPKYDGEVSYDVAADGTCTIKGKGALTASTIEKIGKSNLTKLVLGADFTSVDANVFAKCYGLTEVTFQGQVTLGDGAFLRCNSLEKMNFAAMPTLGTDSIVMQSAIYMKNGLPEVYAIPEITVTGYSTVLVGKVNLTDAKWEDVTDETKKDYHFFRLELRQNQN